MAMAMAKAMDLPRQWTLCVFVLVLALMLVSGSVEAKHYRGSRTIMVGGDLHWKFGYNYTAWALTAGPFHVGDTLVFKYQPAQIGNITIVHNVNLLKDHKAFMKCDFKHAVEIADASRGPSGFEYTLTHHRSYYFACSERGGLHCSAGMMKFSVRPMK